MPQPNRSTAEAQLRAIRALRMHATGKTLEQIAAEVGWKNRSSASRAIAALLAEMKFDAAEDYRQLMLTRIESRYARLTEIFYDTHPYVNDGQVFTDVADMSPNIAAARELRQLDERIARLLGLDAPTRKVVEVLTNDLVDQAIQQELLAMEALDADRSGSTDREAGAAPASSG